MPKRALAERRPWLLASVAMSIAYFVLKDAAFPGTYLFVLEAGCLILLAVYALLRLDEPEARHIAALLGLSGLGVVAVELDPYIGAILLILAYGFGIGLFVRFRRPNMATTQKAAAVALLLLVPLICWRLPYDRSGAVTLAVYGLALGALAGTAWASRFPRYRVGAGAVLVVISSVIGIAQAGPLMDADWPDWVIWPAFYLGNFMMATGTVQTLRKGLRATVEAG